MDVSIIICTSNRAESLQETLVALEKVIVPSNLQCELLIVDNASTDNTKGIVEAAHLSHIPIRYIYEPKKGKGNAYNTGMAQARGEILLWTDDDVRPSTNWIEGMCGPILAGKADAVAGGVKMAPHLERPWMKGIHRACLAETERLNPESPTDMIGANMAFSRHVTSKVPAFDTALGPGALGFADETLFSYQLKAAGYRIVTALDISVEHYFDASRLSRKSFLDTATKLGRSEGYLHHHWHHHERASAWRDLMRSKLRLLFWRGKKGRECLAAEGCPDWEFEMLRDIGAYTQFLIEKDKPRNYEKHGLVKRVQGPEPHPK